MKTGQTMKTGRTTAFLGTLALLAWTTACTAGSAPRAKWTDPIPQAHPDSVEAVVYLVGDAGNVPVGQNVVMKKLAEDVETWSRTLARDSSVAVFFLGDNVYPDGVHDRSHPEFPIDSLKLLSQVEAFSGPYARRYGSTGYFIAGNHDWGQTKGPGGVEQLWNQANLLASFRAEGIPVTMVPEPGDPGPMVVDIGRNARFLVLDTHWWLQAHEDPREDSVLMKVAEGIRTAGGRDVALAAHHPFISGGSHGGPMPIWRGFGILWLLRQTGSLLQDLNSIPYRELLAGLESVFAVTGQPLLFAGGHDHSLQVIQGVHENQPQWSLVSGSGSKLTDVGPAPGMVWAVERPGYMRLFYMRSGAVHLHVFATSEDLGTCEPADGPVEPCVARGLSEFSMVYGGTLRSPETVPRARER